MAKTIDTAHMIHNGSMDNSRDRIKFKNNLSIIIYILKIRYIYIIKFRINTTIQNKNNYFK